MTTLIPIFGISVGAFIATVVANAAASRKIREYGGKAETYLATRLSQVNSSAPKRDALLSLLKDENVKLALTKPTCIYYRRALWCFGASVIVSLVLAAIEMWRGNAFPWISWIQLAMMGVIAFGAFNFYTNNKFFLDLDKLLDG